MLLIEKVVKLLDDFHFEVYQDHVRNINIRSFYPSALIDVIDRDFRVEQDSEYLYRQTYGDPPKDEKDRKKLFQLAYHTFGLTGYLAKNYPSYLHHNVSKIEKLINEGKREEAALLAEMTRDVAEKIEDFDTEIKVLSIQAQMESLLESNIESVKLYERIDLLLELKKQLNKINLFAKQQLKTKGKQAKDFDLESKLEELRTYTKSESFCVQMLARLNICYLLYLQRDSRFFTKENFEEIKSIEKELQKQEFVIFPFLHNVSPKVHYLKLNYSARQADFEEVLTQAKAILKDSQNELFWNSFINLPELNSIGIQTSYLLNNHFTSYRTDHEELLSNEVKDQIKDLIQRCERVLENPLLEEKFIQRYVSMTSVYAGLLLLGNKESIKKSISTLENLLLFFQQVPFHTKIDSIYWTLMMGGFCLQDFENVEKNYRRYKKSTKGKSINMDNDILINGFYFASKWLENGRKQYAKKLKGIIDACHEKPNLKTTERIFREIAKYFEIPIDTR